MAEKQVVKKVENEVPVFFKKESDLGVDSINAQDMVMPRISICQSMSKVKTENKEIKDGEFYNSLTKQSLGQKINVVIVGHWKSIVWFSDDMKLRAMAFYDKQGKLYGFGKEYEQCVTKEWDKRSDTQNYMVLSYNRVKNAIKKNKILFPSILSFSGIANKYAKGLNSKIKINAIQNVPIYGQVIEIGTKFETFTIGSAYEPNFKYTSFVNEDEFKYLKGIYITTKGLISNVMNESETIDTDISDEQKNFGNENNITETKIDSSAPVKEVDPNEPPF